MPLLLRLGLELLECGGIDVDRDLSHLLGQHRLGCHVQVNQHLRAERLVALTCPRRNAPSDLGAGESRVTDVLGPDSHATARPV